MAENDYVIKDIDEEELLELAELFKMFADSTRIKILYDLFDGEKNVSEICEDIAMNQSAVSHQLKALKSGKLVRSRIRLPRSRIHLLFCSDHGQNESKVKVIDGLIVSLFHICRSANQIWRLRFSDFGIFGKSWGFVLALPS